MPYVVSHSELELISKQFCVQNWAAGWWPREAVGGHGGLSGPEPRAARTSSLGTAPRGAETLGLGRPRAATSAGTLSSHARRGEPWFPRGHCFGCIHWGVGEHPDR